MRQVDLKNVNWSENPWIIAEPVIEDPEEIKRLLKKIDECFPEGSEDEHFE